MKCKECDDGSIDCGPVPSELCQDSGGFELAGTFCFKVFVNQGPSGKCKVRIVPCMPKQNVDCEDRTPRKPARKAAKKTRKKVK